jgi:hypothetical protein
MVLRESGGFVEIAWFTIERLADLRMYSDVVMILDQAKQIIEQK